MAKKRKSVSAATRRMREWRAKNGDKSREYMRAWRAANKDKVRAAFRDWQAEHREDRTARQRKWAREHPSEAARWRRENPELARARDKENALRRIDRLREQKAAWAAANPEKVAEAKRRNRDKNRARVARWKAENPKLALATSKANLAKRRYPNTGDIDGAMVLDVIRRAGGKCHWCGKENLKGRDQTLEHLQPFNRIECLTIACYRCNASRRVKQA